MRRDFLYATSFLAGLTVIEALPARPASAQQTAQVGGLEEVIVTARKVEENLMQVPLSIAAVTANDLQAADIKDARDIQPFTPGLWIEYNVSSQAIRSLFFRGDSADAGLTFIDGAPYAGAANPDLNSMERVEVLVGPQSAYFGRSTFSGAINYVTKDPADTFKGRISAEVSSFNSTNDAIVLEGPLVADKLGIRITGSHYYQGGEWANGSDPNNMMGSVQKDTVSAVIVANPSDKLKIKSFLEYSLDNDGYTPTIQLSGYGSSPIATNVPQYQSRQLFCNQGGSFGSYWCGALPQASALPGMDVAGLSHIISADNTITPQIYNVLVNNAYHLEPTLFNPNWLTHTGVKALTLSGHLQATYTSDTGWTFSSNTAIHKTQSEDILSPDYRDDQGVPNPYAISGLVGQGGVGPTGATIPAGSPIASVAVPNYLGFPYFGFHLLNESIQYDGSQEFRLTTPPSWKIRGTIGANYYETVTPGGDNYGLEPVGVTAPGISGMGVAGNLARGVTSTPAVFGGLYYDVTSQLTLSAEAREQWDRISSTTKFVYGAVGGGAQPTLENVFKSFSPRIDVDYKFTPDQMFYALFSEGYKPGGFNSSIVGQTAALVAQLSALGATLTYQQEKIVNWEGGLKSTWLDGKVRTTIDGYYDKWENGQVSNSLSVVTTSGATQMVTVTQNVGLVNLYGIEITAAAAVTKNLTITGNYNYVKSDIRSYFYFPTGGRLTSACAPDNGGTCTIGKEFPNAPVGSTFAITPTYTDHLMGDWDWYTRLDWKHRGRYYIDFVNLAWIPPTNTVDLHVGIKDQNKTIEAFVTNLTNQQNFENGAAGTDATSYNPADVNALRVILPPKRAFGIRGTYSF